MHPVTVILSVELCILDELGVCAARLAVAARTSAKQIPFHRLAYMVISSSSIRVVAFFARVQMRRDGRSTMVFGIPDPNSRRESQHRRSVELAGVRCTTCIAASIFRK